MSDAELIFHAQPPDPSIFETKLDDFEFSVRVVHCFRTEGLVTLADLVRKTEAELLRVPNFGKKSLKEIKDYLATLGLHLDMRVLQPTAQLNLGALVDSIADQLWAAEHDLKCVRDRLTQIKEVVNCLRVEIKGRSRRRRGAKARRSHRLRRQSLGFLLLSARAGSVGGTIRPRV